VGGPQAKREDEIMNFAGGIECYELGLARHWRNGCGYLPLRERVYIRDQRLKSEEGE
jgi:hypothetical protein